MKSYTVFLILTLVLFLFCTLPNLDLPGLGGDESNGLRILIQMFQYPKVMPQVFCRAQMFGKVFPLLDRPYQSSLYIYPYIPFVYIGGVNVYTIRITHIFYGLTILVLCYFLIKKLFDSEKAVITVLLMATHPFFVFGIRNDGEYYIHMILMLIPVLLFLRFYSSKKKMYFYLGSFMLGLGIYYGALFWVFAASILSTLLVCHFRKVRINRKHVKLGILGLLFFLLGSSPLIYCNLKSDGATFKYVLSPFLKKYYSSTNSPYDLQTSTTISPIKTVQQNIITRVKTLKDVMMGLSFPIKSTIPSFSFLVKVASPKIFLNFFSLFIILSALIFSVLKIISRKTSEDEKNRIKIILCFLTFFVLLSSLTSSFFLRDDQLIIIILLLLALSTNFLSFLYKKYKICALILFLGLISTNLVVIIEVHKHFLNYGSFSPEHPSDSIYALGDYFYKNRIGQPINIGGGHNRGDFQNNIFVLTKGGSWSFNLFRSEDSKRYFLDFTKNPESVYVLPVMNKDYKESKEYEQGTYKLFQDYVEEVNKTLVVENVFINRAGKPEYIVYKLR